MLSRTSRQYAYKKKSLKGLYTFNQVKDNSEGQNQIKHTILSYSDPDMY